MKRAWLILAPASGRHFDGRRPVVVGGPSRTHAPMPERVANAPTENREVGRDACACASGADGNVRSIAERAGIPLTQRNYPANLRLEAAVA